MAVLFWGFSFISTKIILTEAPPASIAFFRQIIAVATLLTWVILSLIRGGFAQLARVTWRDAGSGGRLGPVWHRAVFRL